MRGAEVKIPAFTRGKLQLSALEIEGTRNLAILRINVERVIGIVCSKYTILSSTVPIDLVFTRTGEQITHVLRSTCILLLFQKSSSVLYSSCEIVSVHIVCSYSCIEKGDGTVVRCSLANPLRDCYAGSLPAFALSFLV